MSGGNGSGHRGETEKKKQKKNGHRPQTPTDIQEGHMALHIGLQEGHMALHIGLQEGHMAIYIGLQEGHMAIHIALQPVQGYRSHWPV